MQTGIAGAYTLVVLADRLPPAERQPASLEEIRKELDRLSPVTTRQGLSVREPNMRVVDLDTDVLVAGGGLAGVCAALAAARHGARVVLVHDRSRLGGNSSSEVKMHVVGASCHKARPGWREGGIIEELRLEDAVRNPQRSFEMWDLLLYDKVISEPNIRLLLDTTLYAVEKEGERIRRALARCDVSEHVYRIRASIFCDCTGDSRLGLEAGADFRIGREARSEYGESLAPEHADEQTLSSSILFTARDYGRPMPFRPPAWARKVTREHLRLRPVTSWEYGYWWIAWGGQRDTIHDHQRIRFELLSIVLGVWDYIKNSGDHPSSVTWAMDWIGFIPGKRESRRLLGDYVLTQHDILRGDVEDAVAIGGWPMDDHPPAGFDEPELPPNRSVRPEEVYNIPLRALYSRNVPNLMMAGRNISCSHVAFTSTRVMGTCAVVGQAVGTAAAMCVEKGILPRQIYQDKRLLEELQQRLLRDDQTIRGRVNRDPNDLARKAMVRASAEHPAAPASRVIDGYTRDIPLKSGGKEIHQWAARLEPGGVWIELRWSEPQWLGQVQLTFDSGFQRELTLTASETINRGIIRGPQPETVRDYSILYQPPGSSQWIPLVRVEGNYLRMRRHEFAPVLAEAIRVHVDATNGDPYARIFEIRCYGPGA